jgi:hypothetical protein
MSKVIDGKETVNFLAIFDHPLATIDPAPDH